MSVIIKPIISEKAMTQSEQSGVYTFLVDPRANKIQIKQAVEEAYGVTVADVRTMIYAPKLSEKYTKKGLQVGKTNKTKKALVQVAEGESIDVFAN